MKKHKIFINGTLLSGLIFFLLFFNSCTLKNYEIFTLKIESVKSASIKMSYNLPIDLSKEQTNELINELNKSKKNGPTKYMKKYWVQIELKNDSIITIGCNNSIFSSNSFNAYKTSDDFFDKFWKKINGESNSWKLFKPVEYRNQELIQYGNQNFDSKQFENLKNVLDYYSIENIIIENKLYFKGEIDKELNWNYMTKLKDEKWLDEHKNTSY